MAFSGAVRIADGIDDYLAPAQNCVLPLMQPSSSSGDKKTNDSTQAGDSADGQTSARLVLADQTEDALSPQRYRDDDESSMVTVAISSAATTATSNSTTALKRFPIRSRKVVAVNEEETHQHQNQRPTTISGIQVDDSEKHQGQTMSSGPSVVRPSRGLLGKVSRMPKPIASSSNEDNEAKTMSTSIVADVKKPTSPQDAKSSVLQMKPSIFSADTAELTDRTSTASSVPQPLASVVPGANFAQIRTTKSEDGTETASITLTDCLACSGCVTSAETILIGLQSKVEFLRILSRIRRRRGDLPSVQDEDRMGTDSLSEPAVKSQRMDAADAGLEFETCILSLSPQSRVSLSNALGLDEQVFARRLTLFLRAIGVDLVLDTTTAADIALLEAQYEFLVQYLHKLSEGSDSRTDSSSQGEIIASVLPRRAPASSLYTTLAPATKSVLQLPLLASECPGWVCYAEKTQPPQLIEHMSQVKSPQQILGAIIKRVIPKLQAHNTRWRTDKIFHVAVMPCFDKKLEASRDDFVTYLKVDSDGQDGQVKIKDVDVVIATTEMLDILLGNTSSVASASNTSDQSQQMTQSLSEDSNFLELLPPGIASFADLWRATEHATQITSLPDSSSELALSEVTEQLAWVESSKTFAHLSSSNTTTTDDDVKNDPLSVSSYYRTPGSGASGGYADTIFRHTATTLFGVVTNSQHFGLLETASITDSRFSLPLRWLMSSNSDMRAISLEYVGSVQLTECKEDFEAVGVYLLLGKDCAFLLPGLALSTDLIQRLTKLNGQMGVKYSQWRAKAGCRTQFSEDGSTRLQAEEQASITTGLAGAVNMRLGVSHDDVSILAKLAQQAPSSSILSNPEVRRLFSLDQVESAGESSYHWSHGVWTKLAHRIQYVRQQQPHPNAQQLETSVSSNYEARIPTGLCLLWFGQAYGFRNIQNVVRQCNLPRGVLANVALARMAQSTGVRKTALGATSSGQSYHYVEVMACPSGCLNGGGQLRPPDIARARAILCSSKSADEMSSSLLELPSFCTISASEQPSSEDSTEVFAENRSDAITAHSIRAQKVLVAKLDSLFHRHVSIYPEFNPVAHELYSVCHDSCQPDATPRLKFIGGEATSVLFKTKFRSLATQDAPMFQAPKW